MKDILTAKAWTPCLYYGHQENPKNSCCFMSYGIMSLYLGWYLRIPLPSHSGWLKVKHVCVCINTFMHDCMCVCACVPACLCLCVCVCVAYYIECVCVCVRCKERQNYLPLMKLSHKMYVAVSYCLFSHRKVQVSCGRGVDSISHIMSGSERRLGHCVSDIGCIGFSWNDSRRGGGGGGWRKNNFIIHHHIPGLRT